MPAADAPIGIFDSGFGGLTVARAVTDQLPHEDLVYLGDTARAPYGEQPIASVREFAGVLARSVRESSRSAVREDAADLVAQLEGIQHGTGDPTRELAARVEVAAVGTALTRETATSGLP